MFHPMGAIAHTHFGKEEYLLANIPFHVEVPDESSLTGYIMVEQIKSIDYASRGVKFVEKAPQSVVNEVLGILDACLYE